MFEGNFEAVIYDDVDGPAIVKLYLGSLIEVLSKTMGCMKRNLGGVRSFNLAEGYRHSVDCGY